MMHQIDDRTNESPCMLTASTVYEQACRQLFLITASNLIT